MVWGVTDEERVFQQTPEKYGFYVYVETLTSLHRVRAIHSDLLLAPTQLHPNGWAFLRAYQLTLEHLGRTISAPLFYATFTFVRSKKGAWVSLRATEKNFFSLYSNSIKDFKTHYARVVAMNAVAKRRMSNCEHRNLVKVSRELVQTSLLSVTV